MYNGKTQDFRDICRIMGTKCEPNCLVFFPNLNNFTIVYNGYNMVEKFLTSYVYFVSCCAKLNLM